MAGKTAVDIAAEIARHLAHLSSSTDALAFIANQVEIGALALERAACASKVAARAAEVSAVAAMIASGAEYPMEPCEACAGAMFAFESFCKSCGRGIGAPPEAAHGSASESGTYTVSD